MIICLFLFWLKHYELYCSQLQFIIYNHKPLICSKWNGGLPIRC